MSNTERNRTSENILMGYLIDLIQGDETSNHSNQSNINNIIDTINLYQRNVERYHRNMETLIGILRSYLSRQAMENQSIPQNQQQSRDISNNNINNYFRDISNNNINNYFRDISNNNISQYTPFSAYRTTPTYPASTSINTTSTRTPTYTISYASAPATRTQSNGLTSTELANIISDITYSSDESETRCPISFEDFAVGENICKINVCGHIFKRGPLHRWLNDHASCPVCRCSLSSNTNYLTNTNANDNIINNNNIINNFASSIAYSLLSGLNTNPFAIEYVFDMQLDTSGNNTDM
jgi:hypothetical protein